MLHVNLKSWLSIELFYKTQHHTKDELFQIYNKFQYNNKITIFVIVIIIIDE